MKVVGSLAYDRLLDALQDQGFRVSQNGSSAKAQCPAHEDRNPSLSVRPIEGSVLLYCHARCATDDVLAALGLGKADLYDNPTPPRVNGVPAHARYDYSDGRVVVRSDGKQFTQTGNTRATTTVLFHLERLADAVRDGTPVHVVEGEKDVLAVESIGGVATCSPMGAGCWPRVDPEPLRGAHVVVIADKDDAGFAHARDVVTSLTGIAASVRTVTACTGKDAAVHIAAGHGLDEFEPVDSVKNLTAHHAGNAAGNATGNALSDVSETTQGAFRSSWLPVDLTSVLDGSWEPPRPTVGRRTDGRGLFYPGKCHTVVSETEGGKTWLALAACAQEIERGNHVVYLDFEDDEGGIVGRLLTLQVAPDAIRERFHYLRPEGPIGADGVHVRELLADCSPTLAVLDGITEAMTLHGLDPLNNADAATFNRLLPRWMSLAGPAVVSLDHVTKAAESRGRYALGAVHKLNGLNGAQYLLANRTPFGIGLTGRSTVRIAKDRPGQLRAHALPSNDGAWFGDLVVVSHAEGFAEAIIEPPQEHAENWRPTVLMQRVADALGQRGEMASRRMVRTAVTGKDASVLDALDCLILDGYVSEKPPYRLLRAYP